MVLGELDKVGWEAIQKLSVRLEFVVVPLSSAVCAFEVEAEAVWLAFDGNDVDPDSVGIDALRGVFCCNLGINQQLASDAFEGGHLIDSID